ncbi:MAG: cyclase family protein [Nitrospira sp.]|nr:cyclase family protein [Nitrospira sp.]
MMKECMHGLVLSLLLVSAGCNVGQPRLDHPTLEHSRLIDLTHAFGTDTIVWPTEQDFQLVVQQEGETPGGYYYASNRLEMAEHGGTHIDAPIHFAKGGQTLDQIPLDNLVGAGVQIDVSEQCARDRNYRITIQDFERWEATHGRIPARTIVLLDTGFARLWPSRQDYLGTALRGPEGVRALHFPGVHPDAATYGWCASDVSRPSESTPRRSITVNPPILRRMSRFSPGTCRCLKISPTSALFRIWDLR